MSEEKEIKVITVYTDGSGRRQDQGEAHAGGFAYVILYQGRRIEGYGWANGATSNQMELSGILTALTTIKAVGIPVLVRSDSMYCIDALTKWYKGWERCGWVTATGKPVSNKNIIEAILDLIDDHVEAGGGVTFKHVKGHSGVLENERADHLAGFARVEKITNVKKLIEIPDLDFHKHQPKRRTVPHG